MRRHLPDILGTVGLALASAGAWMIYHPAGLIVPGVVLMLLAVAGTRVVPKE